MKKIFLFNTLSRKKELFKPLRKGNVSMYTCGPTVYYFAHIGNLRAYVFSDTLKRALEANGYRVKQVVNITDVGHLTSDADEGEDKVEKSAARERKSAWEIAGFYAKEFKDDIGLLNIKEPALWCKATDHIKEQIGLIKILEKRGYAYTTSDGVYFDTSKFPEYGKLARLRKEKLKAGARVKMREKRSPTDFALWKFSPKGKERQMEWPSPWGVGFPGWHIECSAMSMKYLGKTFDIHTGGVDHIPVHHTNEIAQSEAATGNPFVRYWLHNEHLIVEGKKMAKSLGNAFTIKDIISRGFKPLSFRYLLLTAHYRTRMNFTWLSLEGADRSLESLREKVKELPAGKSGSVKKDVLKIINNDLDTPGLIAKLWDVLRSKKPGEYKRSFVLEADKVLGLGLSGLKKERIPGEIRGLVKERESLRKKGRWEESDKIREKIEKKGFVLEDTEAGTKIKKRKSP